jgi:cytochrome c
MSELEKIVLALAISFFVFLFSDKLGKLFYGPDIYLNKKGYKIAIMEKETNITSTSKTLPEILDITSIMAQASIQEGEKIFNRICTLCHTGTKDGPNKVGPNLWKIVGSKAAHKEDFNYSSAMLARQASGAVWNQEELYRFLFNPKQYVPGTKMAYAGIKDDKERANVIAYLTNLTE